MRLPWADTKVTDKRCVTAQLRDSSAAKETSDPMNQSILKASAGSPREDAGKCVRLSPIGFLVLYLIGSESGGCFLNQSLTSKGSNAKPRQLLSTLKWKGLF